MTVERLIEVLGSYDPELEVRFSQHHFPAASVEEWDIVVADEGFLWFDIPLPDDDNEDEYEADS